MLSKQITLLRIGALALAAGSIAFLLFYAIFGIWILAAIVGVATGIFLAALGGLTLVSLAHKESYLRDLEWAQGVRQRQVQEQAEVSRPQRRLPWRRQKQRQEQPPAIVESRLGEVLAPVDAGSLSSTRRSQRAAKHKAPGDAPARRAQGGTLFARPAGIPFFRRKVQAQGKKKKKT